MPARVPNDMKKYLAYHVIDNGISRVRLIIKHVDNQAEDMNYHIHI